MIELTDALGLGCWSKNDLYVQPEPRQEAPKCGYIRLWLKNQHFFLLRPREMGDKEPKPTAPPGPVPKSTRNKQNKETNVEKVRVQEVSTLSVLSDEEEETQNDSSIEKDKEDLEDDNEKDKTLRCTKVHVGATFTEEELIGLRSNFQDFMNIGSQYYRGGHLVDTLDKFFNRKFKPKSTYAVKRMSTLREVLNAAGSALKTDTTEFISNLSTGQWICFECRGQKFQGGSLSVLSIQTVQSHLQSESHKKQANITRKNGIIREQLVRQSQSAANLSTDALIEVALTSMFISYGVPPYLVPTLLGGDTLELIKSFRSGLHSVKASNETVLTKATNVIHEYMQHDIKGVPFAIIMDAVLTQTDGGKDVLLMYASSPILVDKLKDSSSRDITPTGELLFAEYHYTSSCSAQNQVDKVKEGLTTAGIPIENCEWICGDAAAKNPKTARLLNLPFANCTAHALNLVIKKFMAAFDVTDVIALPSQFVKMGSSMSRRQLCKVFGLVLERLDYSDTRWQGKLETLLYLVGTLDKEQYSIWTLHKEKNKKQLHRLKKQVEASTLRILKEEKKANDEKTSSINASFTGTAQILTEKDEQVDDDDAIDFDDVIVSSASPPDKDEWAHLLRPTVWTQMYNFALASDTATKVAIRLLTALASWKLFAEALLVKELLKDMPAIITMVR